MSKNPGVFITAKGAESGLIQSSACSAVKFSSLISRVVVNKRPVISVIYQNSLFRGL